MEVVRHSGVGGASWTRRLACLGGFLGGQLYLNDHLYPKLVDLHWPVFLGLIGLSAAVCGWLARAQGPRLSALWARLAPWRRPGTWTLLFFLAAYLYTMAGHLYSCDDQFRYRTAQALAEHGSLNLATAPGEVFCSKYGVLHSLLAAPLYLAGRAWSGADDPRRLEAAVSALMPLVSAASAGAFWRLLTSLGFAPRPALATVLTLGLTTMAWPYSRYFFTEPLVGLCFTLAFLGLALHQRGGGARAALLTGLALGLGGLDSLPVLLLTAPLALAGLAASLAGQPPGRRRWSDLAWSLLPLLLAGLTCLWLNQVRFGSPWLTGYEDDHGYPNPAYDGRSGFSTPLYVGLFGLLLSPGKSLFLYSPPLLAAMAFLPRFLRQFRLIGGTALAWCLVWLAFYATWWCWHGDHAWGPRFLVPLLPLLCLPLAVAFRDWSDLGLAARTALWAFLGLGAAVQVTALLVPYEFFIVTRVTPDYANQFLLHFVPQHSPLWGQLQMLPRAVRLDFWPEDNIFAWVACTAAVVLGHLAWWASAGPPAPGNRPSGRNKVNKTGGS